MLSLGLTISDMELGCNDLSTIYEMELETHGNVQVGKKLGFHENQIACYHYG